MTDTTPLIDYIEGRLGKMKAAIAKGKWQDAAEYAKSAKYELEHLASMFEDQGRKV